jgi:tRNA pseudouridine32 synthase / 23S rRNA pseudouridine746 synthase
MPKSYFPSVAIIGSDIKDRTVFEFLCSRFPNITPAIWQERINFGNVFYENKKPVGLPDIAKTGTRIYYYREVENEIIIPFNEKILFRDEHILIADKPHFLQIAPAGKFANETLLNRLKKSTGLDDIVPVNRLDRDTAGLVLFSTNKHTRDAYYKIFRDRLVYKSYKCITEDNPEIKETRLRIENRLIQGEPWFRMKSSKGNVNSITDITLDRRENGFSYFSLHPETGRKHQLRIHMCLIGCPILNDRYYPDLFPESSDDFTKPLKLLAEKLSFKDPLTGRVHDFQTERNLL